MGLLDGVRVLEVGELVAVPYAGKLMADLGADVAKVEPPEGDVARRRGPFRGAPDPEASGLFLALNAGKKGVVLDLSATQGRLQLEELAAGSDVLLHDFAPARAAALGLVPERLAVLHPSLVTCSLTPFGVTGPRRDWRAHEITIAHGGGWGSLAPGALEDPELPPLKSFGHQAHFQAGLVAATASLGALYRARRTGQGEHVDVSAQEVIAAMLEAGLPFYTYSEFLPSRFGARGLNPWGIFECADGRIFVSVIEPDQWERLKEFMGRPEWAELELFADFFSRAKNFDALNVFMQEWIAPWKKDELFHEGQRRRICFAPVLEEKDVAVNEHLAARGFFVDVEHAGAGRVRHLGAPYRLRDGAWAIRGGAPRLGEHTAEVRAERRAVAELQHRGQTPVLQQAELPLSGIRVIDFSWVWAGPYCAMQLAHLGAEVIKLESWQRPDNLRRLHVYPKDSEPHLDHSGYFNQYNQGKLSVLANLASPEARELAKRLVATADVVVENYSHGVMERFGLGWSDLSAVNPRLVYASITGYGQTGPYRSYMGYGPAMAPLSGLASATGYAGGPPRELGLSYGDPTAGINAAFAICAALVDRERTGEGQRIDVSLWESTAALTVEPWMAYAMTGEQPPRMGNRDPLWAPHNLYRCAGDDRWVSIACASDEEWRALAAVVDPHLVRDERFATAALRKAHEDALDAALGAWTAERDGWEITETLQAAGVAAFPCLTVRDIAEDAHLWQRRFLERLEHPSPVVGRRIHAGIPWKLANSPNGVRAPAPCLGQHTDETLQRVLGLGAGEIARLRDSSALA